MPARLHAMKDDWLGWLRGDVWDVVQVVDRRRPRAGAGADSLDVGSGVARWARAFTRQRTLAVSRRWLLMTLAVALIPALIVLLSGGSRPFWVIGVLALALVGVACAQRERVSQAQAARLLDRALGFHEQLGTALELRSNDAQATGLAALVIDDATADVRRSFAIARVTGRRAAVEWAWVAGLACVLALLIALPRHGGSSGRLAHSESTALVLAHGGAPASVRTSTRPSTTTIGATHTASTAVQGAIPQGVGATRWAGAEGATKKGVTLQAKPGSSPAAHGKQSGLAVASTGTTPNASKVGGLNGNANAGAAAGGAGKASQTSSGAKKAAAAGSPHSTSTRASHGAASSAQSAKGTPGGASVGTRKAGASHRAGVVPVLGAGPTQLPLQAGYTPAGAGKVAGGEGQSQSVSGDGGSGGRSGTADSTGGQSGTNFAVIPLNFNSASGSDGDLLQGFFGTADQLSFKGW